MERRQERSWNGLLIIIILIIVLLLITLFTCHHQRNLTTTTSTFPVDSSVLNQLQIPALKSGDEIVQHKAYTLSYNEDHEQANWVAYVLTAKETNSANNERTNKFLSDPLVKTKSASTADYENSGYDRGHLASAEDMAWSKTTMKESFYY